MASDDEFYHLYGDEEYDQATVEDVMLSKCCNHPIDQQPGHFIRCPTIKARKATMRLLDPRERESVAPGDEWYYRSVQNKEGNNADS